MSTTKIAVTEALEKIALDDLLHVGGFKGGARRAVVFYLDRGTGGMASLLWWIQAWKFIGLNRMEEGFDIVIMAHPGAVENIPEECQEIGEDFLPRYGEAGECIYKQYILVRMRYSSKSRSNSFCTPQAFPTETRPMTTI